MGMLLDGAQEHESAWLSPTELPETDTERVFVTPGDEIVVDASVGHLKCAASSARVSLCSLLAGGTARCLLTVTWLERWSAPSSERTSW